MRTGANERTDSRDERHKRLKCTVALNPCPICRGIVSLWMRVCENGVGLRFVACETAGERAEDDCLLYDPPDSFFKATSREAIAHWQRISDPARVAARPICKHFDAWHPDMGPVVWWRFPWARPAYIGTPHDTEWPGDNYSHWTPHPDLPVMERRNVDEIPPEWNVPNE